MGLLGLVRRVHELAARQYRGVHRRLLHWQLGRGSGPLQQRVVHSSGRRRHGGGVSIVSEPKNFVKGIVVFLFNIIPSTLLCMGISGLRTALFVPNISPETLI